MEQVQDFSKPWLAEWLVRLHGLSPYDQTLGVWLAHQANEKGVVEGVDWERLVVATGMSAYKARQSLRNGPLVTLGLIKRKVRHVGEGNLYMPTVYTLVVKPK